MDRSFEVFNADGTKNKEVMRSVPLKLEINKHTEKINIVVIDLNSMDIFLEYDWLIKHNPEVNQNRETIQFTRCQSAEHSTIILHSHQELENYNQQKIQIKNTRKPTRNQIQQTQRIYQNIFNHSCICSTRRKLRSYQNGGNKITKLIYQKTCQRSYLPKPI